MMVSERSEHSIHLIEGLKQKMSCIFRSAFMPPTANARTQLRDVGCGALAGASADGEISHHSCTFAGLVLGREGLRSKSGRYNPTHEPIEHIFNVFSSAGPDLPPQISRQKIQKSSSYYLQYALNRSVGI